MDHAPGTLIKRVKLAEAWMHHAISFGSRGADRSRFEWACTVTTPRQSRFETVRTRMEQISAGRRRLEIHEARRWGGTPPGLGDEEASDKRTGETTHRRAVAQLALRSHLAGRQCPPPGLCSTRGRQTVVSTLHATRERSDAKQITSTEYHLGDRDTSRQSPILRLTCYEYVRTYHTTATTVACLLLLGAPTAHTAHRAPAEPVGTGHFSPGHNSTVDTLDWKLHYGPEIFSNAAMTRIAGPPQMSHGEQNLPSPNIQYEGRGVGVADFAITFCVQPSALLVSIHERGLTVTVETRSKIHNYETSDNYKRPRNQSLESREGKRPRAWGCSKLVEVETTPHQLRHITCRSLRLAVVIGMSLDFDPVA